MKLLRKWATLVDDQDPNLEDGPFGDEWFPIVDYYAGLLEKQELLYETFEKDPGPWMKVVARSLEYEKKEEKGAKKKKGRKGKSVLKDLDEMVIDSSNLPSSKESAPQEPLEA